MVFCRQALGVGVVFVMLSLAVGCNNGAPPPTAPSAPAPAAPSPPARQPMASLVIENATIFVAPQVDRPGWFTYYQPRFRLKETGGQSGATIQKIFLEPSGGPGPSCWRLDLRVAPGATIDTFDTDEGWKSLSDCGGYGGSTQSTTIRIAVTFTDDAGVNGRTETTVTASPAPRATAASLAIENASISVIPQVDRPGWFIYQPRFQLRETSGQSGATIQNVLVGVPFGGGDNTGPGCWGADLRAGPGGTLDTFYTDEGWNWLGYCRVVSYGPTRSGTVQIVVSFTDDAGVPGTTSAIVSTTE